MALSWQSVKYLLFPYLTAGAPYYEYQIHPNAVHARLLEFSILRNLVQEQLLR